LNTQSLSNSTEIKHNTKLQVLAQLASKLGDALSNTKVILPALLTQMGAPSFMLSFVVPIREAFSMLPQLLLSDRLARLPLKKYAYSVGAGLQGLAIALMLLATLSLKGWAGGAALLFCLFLFALARSLCSLSSKDVLGKTIPKSARGKVMGLSASLAGFITIGLGSVLYMLSQGGFSGGSEASLLTHSSTAAALSSVGDLSAQLSSQHSILALCLCGAVVSFFAAGLTYTRIREQRDSEKRELLDSEKREPLNSSPSAPDNTLESSSSKSNQSNQPSARLGLLLRDDLDFRHFVVTRAMMMVSALAAPFIVAQALDCSFALAGTVFIFIVIEGTTGLISGRFWGRFADHNSKLALRVCATLTALICALAALLSSAWFSAIKTTNAFSITDRSLYMTWIICYAALSLTHHGVRLARKTYVVDMAEGKQRTLYVAASNTCIGLLLLLAGALSAVLANVSSSMVFLLFALTSAYSVFYARGLKTL
jgi:hypothetical protein